nr:lysine--tRNA ligase [Blochmannia endosymbiont of Polyrhachis (Hedomyrma) turneri]
MRREKLSKLRCNGVAFPNDFRRNVVSDCLHKRYGNKSNEELYLLNIDVKIAGRMMSRRIMGKVSFATIQDMGGMIQLYIAYDSLPVGLYNDHFKKWDIGDILGVRGTLFKTKTGELSVYCKEIYLLTKSLHPLPDKYHKLVDQEIRYRKRYLDLIINHKVRNIFKIRSLIIFEIRKFMLRHGFLEVETPMMQPIAGGACARPFVTRHNTLNIDMYLRISPELYLKRLVVGGFEKIFEINRNFRNEGISSLHNPEFTMMEIYVAYVDYRDLIVLLERLLRTLAKRILGSYVVKYGNYMLNFSQPFLQMTMHESIFYYYPHLQLEDINNVKNLIAFALSFGIKIDNTWKLGKIQTVIFEKLVVNHLIQPTVITSYPTEVSPLARARDDNSFFSDRFEVFVAGREIANGFSELNDSEEQKARFLEQLQDNDNDNNGGNMDNNMVNYDKDYLTALEYGLPPTAGMGIGIDRVIMLLTNQHTIRNVILFPTLRPKNK